MTYPRHKYLAPEPGDTGGTDSGTEPAAADPIVIDTPEPEPIEASDQSTADKVGALLDNIGKPEGEGEPGETAKPAEPAGEKAPPKEPVNDDDAPPEGASDKTKGRWAQLAERAKAVPELERRATEAEGQVNSLRELVTATGLQPAEFQGMLEMGRLFKSSKPEDLQSALAQIDGIRTDIATRLGIDAPGVDPLAKHADLQKDVEEMTITRPRALEIAKLRDQGARSEEATAAHREQQEFHSTLQSAAKTMDDVIAQRAATPGHQAKVDFIKSKLADPAYVNQFVTTYRPDQWQSVILTMYDAYTPPAAPATPGPTGPQALRPGHVSAGVRQIGSKPVSSTQAVENAFDSIGL